MRLAVVIPRPFVGMRRILDPSAFPFVAAAVALVVAVGGLALYIGETGEGYSVSDAVWWSLTTVTTVGYGDIVPHTAVGRIVAAVVMLVGITFTSLLTAQAAAYLAAERQEDESENLRADIASLAAQVDSLAEDVRRLVEREDQR